MSSLESVVDTLLENYGGNGVIHTYDVERLASFSPRLAAKYRMESRFLVQAVEEVTYIGYI